MQPVSDLADWIPAYIADELRPEVLATWVARTQHAIAEELPHLAPHDDLVEVLADAVHDHWVSFLTALAQNESEFSLVPAARRLAEKVAEHQLPVETLLSIYRVARSETWSYVTQIARRPLDLDLAAADIIIHVWDRASRWIDLSLSSSIESFHVSRAHLLKNVAARRFEVVRNLVATDNQQDLRAVSSALGGYPLSVVHTAFVVGSGSAPEGSTKVGTDLATLLGGSLLMVEPGGTIAWGWIGTRDVPDLGDLDCLTATLRGSGLRLSIGVPASGLRGFRSSHRQALRADDVATRPGSVGLVTRFDQVELLSLLGCNEDVDRFVRRALGALADHGAPPRRMRDTLGALLERGGSIESAAKELCVHRNTVRYRMEQVEAVIPRPVDDHHAELAVALRHLALYHPEGIDDDTA
ncbi:MAG: helix-turn-helix domain-containing protein [Nocardioides sp.]|uniref:helix-turn-helix domain-containing protein n=1 Tax=Nocardioides sp. TaxID=35761 RepID=UPI002385C7B9|nr:helix-turn-helix domain-containing protein [Nocardioides sp.]MDE0777003.1 helix-turn-helix domain-containing protein [Nocardioides sp.]